MTGKGCTIHTILYVFFADQCEKKTLILYLKVTGEDGKKKKKEKKATEMMTFDIYYLSSPDAGL